MGFDLYGINPQKDDVGDYFRANVWFWRPIWSFVCGSCDNILTERDIEAGSYNDGHKISKTKSKRIASKLRSLDKGGVIQVWEDDMNVFIEKSRKHNEKVKVKMDKITKACHKKHGNGLVPIDYPEPYKTQWNNAQREEEWGSHYPASRDEIIRFAEFCEYSGGFEIC